MFPSSNMCPLIPPAPLTSDYSATVQKSVISNSYDNFAISSLFEVMVCITPLMAFIAGVCPLVVALSVLAEK